MKTGGTDEARDQDDITTSPTRRKHYVGLMACLSVIMTIAASVATAAAINAHDAVDDLEDDIEALETGQTQGRERTWRSQALSCSIKLAIGGDVSEDAACQDEHVLELYDPDAEPVVFGLTETVDGG